MKIAIVYNLYANIDNLLFFIKNGIYENDIYDYYFINNGNYPVEMSKKSELYLYHIKNVKIHQRENKGYDYGAYSYFIEKYKDILYTYDYFIFMNDTVIGPFFPVWFKEKYKWPILFTDMINEEYKLTGISINQIPDPIVQGMLFCTDKIGLNILMENNIFNNCDNETKQEIIDNHEIKSSRVISNSGFKVTSLLKADQCNKNRQHQDPWFHDHYLGKTPHPYETIFNKTNTYKRTNFNEIVELHKQCDNG